MIGELIECQHTGCDINFTKKTHNQRYHDDECCRLATNAKIMQKYYAKRAQKLGHPRFCVVCEKAKLSRYNSSNTCNSCSLQSEIDKNQSVTNMLADVAWVS